MDSTSKKHSAALRDYELEYLLQSESEQIFVETHPAWFPLWILPRLSPGGRG
jgi:hypothetical protein